MEEFTTENSQKEQESEDEQITRPEDAETVSDSD
jgi:hypothetical protein